MANTDKIGNISMSGLTHPSYRKKTDDMMKYDLVYEGGTLAKQRYLKKFSKREDNASFQQRVEMSYFPGIARSLLNEKKDSLYQRLRGIKRIGGPQSYRDAVNGDNAGADGKGTSIQHIIGLQVLLPLMKLGKVGVLVDRSKITSPTMGSDSPAPYLSVIDPRNILSWTTQDPGLPGQFKAVKLLENVAEQNSEGLPLTSTEIVRTMWQVWLLDNLGRKHSVIHWRTETTEKVVEEGLLDLPVVPFAVAELTDSLLKDVADYEIALLQLSSSDLSFLIKANYPTYTEQVDNQGVNNHLVKPDGLQPGNGQQEIGTVDGRAYGKNLDRPDFIAPPTEPLLASMKKQEQMEEQMRSLMSMTLSTTKSVSAQSKEMDSRSMESGASYIGVELEHLERMIALIWAEYEQAEPAEVYYPEIYSLETEAEALKKAEQLSERSKEVPSRTYKKEVYKEISRTMLRHRVDDDTMKKIEKEIEEATILIADPEIVLQAQMQGICSDKSAGLAIGFSESEAAQAAKDHAARTMRIAQAAAQGQAMGNPNGHIPGQPNQPAAAGKKVSQDAANNTDGTGKRGRGSGKKNLGNKN